MGGGVWHSALMWSERNPGAMHAWWLPRRTGVGSTAWEHGLGHVRPLARSRCCSQRNRGGGHEGLLPEAIAAADGVDARSSGRVPAQRWAPCQGDCHPSIQTTSCLPSGSNSSQRTWRAACLSCLLLAGLTAHLACGLWQATWRLCRAGGARCQTCSPEAARIVRGRNGRLSTRCARWPPCAA